VTSPERPPAPVLRRATGADVPGIETIVNAAYGHYVERIGRQPKPMAADQAAAVRDHEVWVLDDGGETIAVLELIEVEDHLFIENVAVHPQYQGMGLGRRLLDHAESVARAGGRPEIRLETNEHFVENLAIYRARGYEEIGRTPRGGTDVVELRKRL
jgi:ribosomal protein S18 acetylase RimI-like enzyme